MSDVKTSTATAVQVLIDAGAVVVGKNKLAEFAFASHFVTENVDYLLPFNPRGDGYNTPGASSGGSAAAVASYDRLDVTLGSDTGGSIRAPAFYNGVHGNRPSLGAVGMEGALPLSSTLDTAGTLARDPEIWSRVNRVLYGNLTDNFTSYPKMIIIDGGQYCSALERAGDCVSRSPRRSARVHRCSGGSPRS
jgi:Asp-tRNA(Asn)/Glu-tRNA(Gln) amidotransferase A subunit family amidase